MDKNLYKLLILNEETRAERARERELANREKGLASILRSLDDIWLLFGRADVKAGSSEFTADDIGMDNLQNLLQRLEKKIASLQQSVVNMRKQVAKVKEEI